MAYLFRDPKGKMISILQLDHQPIAGTGTCVDLAKVYAAGLEGRSTKTWRAGARVIDLTAIPPGVAIATFIEIDGKLVYPGWDGGNHFAFSVRASEKVSGKSTELVVMDQFNSYNGFRGPEITTRRSGIPAKPRHLKNGKPDMSNDLRYFYIIE